MTRYAQRTLIGQPGLANWGKAAAGGIGVVQGYGIATGGTSSSITVSTQAYTLLSFTSDSSLVVTSAGLFDVLLVGGGAAGGSARSNYGTGGGGGGGGVMQQTIYLDAGTYTVDVGAPGAESSGNPSTREGKESAIYSAKNLGIAVSGGGASASPYNSSFASSGATGGGAWNGGTGAPGSSFGYAGGNGGSSGTYNGGGGGGGGAGAVGTNGSGSTAGNGGAGVEINTFISGASSFKGGGGGGGGSPYGSAGSGNGSANTGGGGRGGWAADNADGLVGYSGAVFVRFKV